MRKREVTHTERTKLLPYFGELCLCFKCNSHRLTDFVAHRMEISRSESRTVNWREGAVSRDGIREWMGMSVGGGRANGVGAFVLV